MRRARSAGERRVSLVGAVLGLVVIGVMIVVGYAADLAVPAVIGMLVTVAVIGFVGYVGRDEYRVARNEGMAPLRAVARAIRKTIDMFVLGK